MAVSPLAGKLSFRKRVEKGLTGNGALSSIKESTFPVQPLMYGLGQLSSKHGRKELWAIEPYREYIDTSGCGDLPQESGRVRGEIGIAV
jgi:hypothetical protein